MRTGKKPSDSLILSRRLVMPDELNPNGTLFGGVLMAWIDIIAFMTAERHAGTPRVVTASVDRLEFLEPLRMGDHVVLTGRVEWVGTSSMAVEVAVEKEARGIRSEVATAHLTFVALGDDGKPTPVPVLTLESDEERQRFEAARVRMKVQQRYRRWREKKRMQPPLAS